MRVLTVLLLLGAAPILAAPLSIENDTVRVTVATQDGRYWLEFRAKRGDGSWRPVLATAAEATGAPWGSNRQMVSEDPQIVWKQGGGVLESEAFFTKAEAIDVQTLILTGGAAGQVIEERVTIASPGRVHIDVRGITASPIELSRLMSNFYLVPDGKAFGYALPLDFAWLPVLHWEADDLASDHFFRSPVVMAMAHGAYAALVPDLTLIERSRPVPHALDLRVTRVKAEAPRLSYGLSTSEVVPHTFARHRDDQTVPVIGTQVHYAFDVLLGEAKLPEEVTERLTSYLWKTYGEGFWQDIRPQVLPFEEYGRRYSYVHELRRWATRVDLPGGRVYGLNNTHRRGANFHAWENDVHVGFGTTYYARKWGDKDLEEIGEGLLRLSLSSPRRDGAFPCIYNLSDHQWEGSLFWTARSADPFAGYDAAAMGVTAWWQLYWLENLKKDQAEIRERVISYARFLEREQLASGAIPTYYYKDLTPAPQLKEAGTTALSGAVLAKAALLMKDERLQVAAVEAGRFVERELMPRLKFQDFESFYSCSPTPVLWADPWTGLLPQNNLAIEWAADEFLALYRLTGERHWLEKGEYILSNLSLYQQVWAPPYYATYLYGGFGVMNTDGEWNDGRQARFVSTYADYYLATRKPEYLERAVAAARAGFALMDISENHGNNINQLSVPPGVGLTQAEGAGQGYAPENVYHGGPKSLTGWTGFNWSSGGALAAAAYLDAKFGTVWVDGETKRAFAIDGVRASVVSWDGHAISLHVDNVLKDLPHPYSAEREIKIKFGGLNRATYDVTVDGQAFRNRTAEELETGLTVRI